MQKIFQKNQLVAESAKALWHAFERDLDPGRLESMARKFASGEALPSGWQFLGEGADQVVIGRQEYAVLMPKAGFLKAQRDEGRRWLDALRRLAREARLRLMDCGVVTLVPPMAVMTNPPGIIMVRGAASPGLRPPDEALENTRTLLGELRLELADGPQLITVGGCPFIHDWSGLGPASDTARNQVLESSISF